MRRLLFIAPAVAFVALLGVFIFGLRKDPTLLPSTMIGKPAPAFVLPPVRPTDDRGLETADLKGPLLLNYYASWCATCYLEHPMLMRLKDQGITIYGVDWKDKPELGDKWLNDRGDPYIRVGNDLSGRTGIDMGVSAVPETFVIDKQGRIRYRHVGAISEEDWARTLAPLMVKLRAES